MTLRLAKEDEAGAAHRCEGCNHRTALFLDVGQGDATLLVAADAAVLVDTGRHDRDDVLGHLSRLDVDALDVVVVTHPHADHIGQFDKVIERSTWPRCGGRALPIPPRPSSGRWRHTESATERRMVADYSDWVGVDVYQVGHHGSSTSTTQELLDAATPAVAVYSAGAGNQYGHPAPEVVERLEAAGVEVYGTDVHGSVTVTTDGTDWEIVTERDGSIDVAPQPESEPEPEPESEPETESACASGQADVNAAGFEELQAIIHIGPDRAQQVVDLRPFSSVEALTRVSGIAEGRLADIKSQGAACAG